jgi:hypothetical protein
MGEDAKKTIGTDLLSYSQLSQHLAKERISHKDWSGLPVPIAGLELVLEPRYKHAALSDFRWKECYDENGVRQTIQEPPPPQPSRYRRVNSWWNERYQLTVVVLKDKQGRASYNIAFRDRLAFTVRTMEASAAWPVEAEHKAQKTLATLISQEAFESYVLTGSFPETSTRSQVTYLFRKGRPTIALRQDNESVTSVLCALCLHPIGYYGESWAGVMCPTDEVIAHLLMMRGSEEKFWANANQHPIDHPAAGL